MIWQPINLLLSTLTLGGAFFAALQVSLFSVAAPPTAMPPTAMNASHEANISYAANTSPSGPHEINRAPDGLFYVNGSINGVSVRFAVDTGASVVVLNTADAKRVGWNVSPNSSQRIRTASGYGNMAWREADEVNVAGKSLGNLDVAVMHGGPEFSLLGLNALSQFNSITIKNDQMIIE